MAMKQLARLADEFEWFVVVAGEPARFHYLPQLWIDGRHKSNIKMDRNTHSLSGKRHFHIYGKPRGGRKGKLIAIVKEDGTRSHGSGEIKLHEDDAAALRAMGVPVPASNVVKWELPKNSDLAFLFIATEFVSTSASSPTR